MRCCAERREPQAFCCGPTLEKRTKRSSNRARDCWKGEKWYGANLFLCKLQCLFGRLLLFTFHDLLGLLELFLRFERLLLPNLLCCGRCSRSLSFDLLALGLCAGKHTVIQQSCTERWAPKQPTDLLSLGDCERNSVHLFCLLLAQQFLLLFLLPHPLECLLIHPVSRFFLRFHFCRCGCRLRPLQNWSRCSFRSSTGSKGQPGVCRC